MGGHDHGRLLESLYVQYNSKRHLSDDPLFFVQMFREREDIEIAALLSSSLAYGNVRTIGQSVQKVLCAMQPSPYWFVRSFHPEEWEHRFGSFRHRFSSGEDIANLLYFMKQIMEGWGSIEHFFMEGYDPGNGIEKALASFSERTLHLDRVEVPRDAQGREGTSSFRCRKSNSVAFFFPSPESGSACKRLNLFLRWMVRKDNLDLGLWTRISKSELVIPVDTHIAEAAQRFGFTRRKNPSWEMALEITEALKRFDSDDPVKYDFALCHCRTWP